MLQGKTPGISSFCGGISPGKTTQISTAFEGSLQVKFPHRSCKDPSVSFQRVVPCDMLDSPHCRQKTCINQNQFAELNIFLCFVSRVKTFDLQIWIRKSNVFRLSFKFWKHIDQCVVVPSTILEAGFLAQQLLFVLLVFTECLNCPPNLNLI